MPHTQPDDQVSRRLVELTSALARAGDGLSDDPTGTNAPLPELADPAGDYGLRVWVHFAYDRDGAGHRPLVATGDYVLECGRKDGHCTPRHNILALPHFR